MGVIMAQRLVMVWMWESMALVLMFLSYVKERFMFVLCRIVEVGAYKYQREGGFRFCFRYIMIGVV